MKLIHRFCLLLVVFVLFPGLAFAVDDFFKYKDVEFHLKGDYQAYGKYFNERDINGYNGNATGTDPISGQTIRLQTDKTERWFEHELRLSPWIVFNDKLEFYMRFDVGKYIFQSDYADRLYTTNETCVAYVASDDVQRARDDYEKIRAEEAFVKMITPVGLFVVGRFEEGNHGIVYGIQLPPIPKWTFVLAWNKKNEGKLDYEKPYVDYLHCPQMDYMDRDDQNEVRFLAIYEDKDKGIYSEGVLDFRLGASHSAAKNMKICMPQWKFEYDKEGNFLQLQLGTGMGKIAELKKMPEAQDIKDLVSNGLTLASVNPGYEFPYIRPKNMGPPTGFLGTYTMAIIASSDIGKLTPEIGFGRCAGADSYDEVAAFWWDWFEPQGYRTPRYIKSLLLGEIEDKYYPVLATYATNAAFDQDDVSFHNMTFAKLGTTYRITDKMEVFGQALAAWRTSTKYYEKEYWDFFPLMYALNNMTTDATTGNTTVPFVFKKTDTTYYQSIDNFLGIEIDGRLTYKLFDGLDVSLLGAYFSPGDFYKDVLTPKPYIMQSVTIDPAGNIVDSESPVPIKGPYGYTTFDIEDAWTIQLKVDFKWEI